MRPEFITSQQIERWEQILSEDPNFSPDFLESIVLKEVCFAGLYLGEQLEELGCAEDLIFRIQFTAGKLSFGREPWQIHLEILSDYKNNKLVYD